MRTIEQCEALVIDAGKPTSVGSHEVMMNLAKALKERLENEKKLNKRFEESEMALKVAIEIVREAKEFLREKRIIIECDIVGTLERVVDHFFYNGAPSYGTDPILKEAREVLRVYKEK